LWLLDKATLLVDHLVDLKLCDAIGRDGAHTIIDFLLADVGERAIDCITVAASGVLIQVRIVELLVQNSTEGEAGVELDPGWRQHEVDMALHLVAPEFDHSAQVELADDLVRLDECVHVRLQAMLRVHRLLVKFDFNEAVRVRSNDEVDFSPVDHDNLLYIVDDVWQLLWGQSL